MEGNKVSLKRNRTESNMKRKGDEVEKTEKWSVLCHSQSHYPQTKTQFLSSLLSSIQQLFIWVIMQLSLFLFVSYFMVRPISQVIPLRGKDFTWVVSVRTSLYIHEFYKNKLNNFFICCYRK